MNTIIEYPAWHDEARAMRDNGKTLSEIADHFEMTPNRMGQIATPNWQSYLLAYRTKSSNGRKHATIGEVRGLVKNFEFKSIPSELAPKPRKYIRPFVKLEDEFLPSPRDFKPLKRFDSSIGKTFVGAEIECAQCHAKASYFKNAGSVNPAYLPHEFAKMGWQVGKSARADLCPACSKFHKPDHTTLEVPRVATLIKKEEPVLTSIQKPIVFALAPQPVTEAIKSVPAPVAATGIQTLSAASSDMSRMDRRLIFAKLNDVYGDEKTGYQGDWDDAKVAADLGVDKSWVSEVRGEDFGPETNAKMMRASIDEIIKAGEAIERRVVLIDKKIEQMQALDSKIEAARKEVEGTIERFQQLMGNLTTQDDQMQSLLDGFNGEVMDFKKKYEELKA